MSRLRSIVGALLLLGTAGCSAFMAGYRSGYVKNIQVGMSASGVASLAGSPQRREAVSTATGPVEVWYYHVPATGGGFEERPIIFANGQVAAVGREGLATLGSQDQGAQQAQLRAELYQIFLSGYRAGYQQGHTDRDAAWQAAVQEAAPQIEARIKKAELAGFRAGEKAGQDKTMAQVQAAFEEYLRDAQRGAQKDEQKKDPNRRAVGL